MPRLPGARRLAHTTSVALVLAALCTAQGALAQSPPVAPTPTQVSPEVDRAYAQLMASPAIQKLLDAVKADHERSVEDLKTLTEIEAPPFKEHRRAEAFLARMKALGLSHAKIDAEGNVVGLRKGTGGGPLLVVSAHLDTVFPAGTDVKVKERDGRLYAPGIADDTRGLSVLLSWLKVLNDNKVQTVGDLLFVGNVGEEELGNLRGMKAIFNEHLDIDGMVGLEPSPAGSVLVLGTASHRYEVTFQGPGGHSFGAFGLVPSAIHGMGRAIAKIADVRTPSFPKTTFTVGTVGGGTSVNTIAPDARMAIDIRSDDMASLLEAEKKILAAIDEAVVEENKRWGVTSLSASTKLIGDRPGGRTPADSVIVEAATRANAAFGHRTLLRGGSTDANVPISLGIPAIIVGGGGKASGAHSLAESIDVTDGWKGAQNSLVTVLGLVGVQGVSPALLPKRTARTK
ncbi:MULTISPECIES: M20/M25/M40 family metallo-hydrolase [unclassified Variovorax]|uniref:M20/M25/M40 family metallo-hydrolase n=1 Tax=unclassified Variovorax TaxID=663243 RepID=UPI0008D81D87|nr:MULTISPECIES: M20/M25/M40 family metallo-hydrolase [unclassified Variovorax]SEJ94983.1 Acetylornithine deacetylase/Succinyl-diaminopimelate desuccinylase [Variovorax sp. OK202]SFD18547.1 Acetylornithine deacetylase/Succinyl-diaminopimelate desuccinylase [Variovorax sp. OK212]